MTHRFDLALVVCSVVGVTLGLSEPSVRPAAAQNNDQRRGDESGDAGRGGRGDGRGGRGRFGGGNEGEGGGRRGFFRRGGPEGDGNRGPERADNPSAGRSQHLGGSPSSNSSSRPTSAFSSSLRTEDYARGLIKQHDKDGDMMLKGDELKDLAGKPATADINKDGVITLDELVSTLSGNTPTPAASTASSAASKGASKSSRGNSVEDGDRGRRGERRRGRDRGGEGDGHGGTSDNASRVYTALSTGSNGGKSPEDSDKAAKQRTYRFTRGADRLPATGLPSWFKSRDANGDGQVELSEYSKAWSDSTVKEFRRYDLDNDGIVTAKEAAGK